MPDFITRFANSPSEKQLSEHVTASHGVSKGVEHASSQATDHLTGEHTSFYLIESAREGERLETKIDKSATIKQLQLTGLRPGMDALNLGCGTWVVTRVMSGIVAPERAIGVDISPRRLAEARQFALQHGQSVEFFEGSAAQIPLPTNSVDYSWFRFLFEYLPDSRQPSPKWCVSLAPVAPLW